MDTSDVETMVKDGTLNAEDVIRKESRWEFECPRCSKGGMKTYIFKSSPEGPFKCEKCGWVSWQGK